MNLEITASSNLVENLGWTLVHSVWQIALIAANLFLIFRICKNLSAHARYLFSVSALILALVLSAVTFISLSSSSALHENLMSSGVVNLRSNGRAKNLLADSEVFVNDGASLKSPTTEQPTFSLDNFQLNLREKVASVLPVLVWLWLFGVGVYAAKLWGGFWQIHKYKTTGTSNALPEWQKRFFELCEKLNVSHRVKLLQSDLIKAPIVVGWLKPVILVPASVFLQMNPRELETILAHELVHIRRYDNLVNFLQSFIEILFFYHPCVWWLSGVIRREREYACDDAVLEILGSQRQIVYAEALANLEEIRQTANEKMPPLTMAASGGKLMKRIERIIEKNTEIKRSSPKQSFWSASLALLLISAVLISVFSTQTALSVNAKSAAAEKKIAVGFVSLPPVDRINPPQDADATMRLLIEKLKAHRVPAIGFVQGSMISSSDGEKLFPVRADMVRLWRDAGLEIGIGNFKHIWFYNTPFQDYVAGVEKNEKITKSLLAEKNGQLSFFSYPYLNTGKTDEEHQRFEAWLKNRGLRSVKYTFDNQEWMYSFAYDMARKDNDVNTMREIRAAFLDYMSKMLAHYENYSQEMFGREIAQTMVLTSSRLVADTADDLFGTFEKQGYKFVSMNEAQADEAYDTPENFVGQSGISWFERWQMAKGKKLLNEPKVSPLVDKIWNERKNTK